LGRGARREKGKVSSSSNERGVRSRGKYSLRSSQPRSLRLLRNSLKFPLLQNLRSCSILSGLHRPTSSLRLVSPVSNPDAFGPNRASIRRWNHGDRLKGKFAMYHIAYSSDLGLGVVDTSENSLRRKEVDGEGKVRLQQTRGWCDCW